MVENDLELLLTYPLISCKIQDGRKHYIGSVLCGNCDVNLEIFEEINSTNNVSFKLKTIFGDTIDANIANIKYSSIKEFVDKIVAVLKQHNESIQKNYTNVYRKIFREYSEFTQFYLNIKECNISTDLTKITVTTVDDGSRDHVLEILVDVDKTRDIFTPVNLNLPDKFILHFPNNFSNLTEIYSKFNEGLQCLQPFFDVMDDLDGNCYILDPDQPTRRDCYRRIWLGENLSVMVIVDPMNARARPEIKFLGPERITDQYLEKLNKKLEDWQENTQLSQNLLNILELRVFPSKPRIEGVMLIHTGECNICFSLRVNDRLPEVICENRCCENFYHVECLYEWLISVNSKRMFGKLHGHCPNCDKKITCPLPETAFAESDLC